MFPSAAPVATSALVAERHAGERRPPKPELARRSLVAATTERGNDVARRAHGDREEGRQLAERERVTERRAALDVDAAGRAAPVGAVLARPADDEPDPRAPRPFRSTARWGSCRS